MRNPKPRMTMRILCLSKPKMKKMTVMSDDGHLFMRLDTQEVQRVHFRVNFVNLLKKLKVITFLRALRKSVRNAPFAPLESSKSSLRICFYNSRVTEPDMLGTFELFVVYWTRRVCRKGQGTRQGPAPRFEKFRSSLMEGWSIFSSIEYSLRHIIVKEDSLRL